MSRRVTLKSKDAAALKEFLEGIRATLGNNLVEVKLFGSKAIGKDQTRVRHRRSCCSREGRR
jgi:hypothetical protein